MWDGVTAYATPGPVPRLYLKDGPVLNLNLTSAGALESAKPSVSATLGSPGLVEPPPVVLPASQDKPVA
jgi:hypothetical protein